MESKKSIEEQMKLYFRFFTFMGQFPFKITNKGLERSVILKVCGIGPVIVIVATAIIRVKFELPNLEIREAALRSAFMLLGLCLAGTTLILPVCKSDLHRSVFQTFNRVEKYFCYLGIGAEERENVYPPLLILFKHVLIMVMTIVAECASPYWIRQKLPICGMTFYWTATAIMTFIITNCETYAHLLITRYHEINKELINMDRKLKFGMDKIFETSANGTDQSNETTNILRTNKSHSSLKNNEDVAANVRLLQRSHYELYGIYSSLGSLFTFPIVLTILSLGCEILVSCYNGLGNILNDGSVNPLQMLTWVKYVIFDFFRIICILRAVTSIEKTGNLTSYHVHGLIVKSEDSDAQKELIKFSNQLHHQKLNFSNVGFFSLDMSLLASMTGAITTYLVILLQSSGKGNNGSGIPRDCSEYFNQNFNKTTHCI